MRSPVFTQQVQCALGQGHITIFGAFPASDVDHHSVAVNITYPKICPFPQPQATGVNCRQANTIMLAAYCAQDLAYLLQAEHNWQFFLPGWSHQVEDGPSLLECELVEKLDAAQSNLKRGSRDPPFVLQVQEVLT